MIKFNNKPIKTLSNHKYWISAYRKRNYFKEIMMIIKTSNMMIE